MGKKRNPSKPAPKKETKPTQNEDIQPVKPVADKEMEAEKDNDTNTANDAAKPVKNANCECKKVGKWWYCLRQDNFGRLVLCDGPFETKRECEELAVCEE